MRIRALFPFALLLLPFSGCSSDDADAPAAPATPGGDGARLHALPPLASAATTLEVTLAPEHPGGKATGPNPAHPENLASYVDEGYGRLVEKGGEPHVTRSIDGAAPPAAGPNAKRLSRFVHLADLQIADDESPMRLGNFDTTGATNAALRPQDAHLCRLANAAVRTINGVHRTEALEFVLMGGDNADSAQTNEVDWVLGILNGSDEVHCDSGDDDDVVPGADNDGKDPFFAEGLEVPWKWVTGNHDVLIQGNVAVDDGKKKTALGSKCIGGTRDYTQGGAIEDGDFAVPDAERALLTRVELMSKLASDGDGHGIGAEQKASGKAFYSFDVEGTPLRFLVLDTGSEAGGADGMLHQADVDAVVKPALDAAKADGKWVILSSHHAADQLTSDGGAFGTEQSDAVLPDAWKSFLGGYPNVLFSLVGHSHENLVHVIETGGGGHAYWEVKTSAIAHFPHQLRIVEIWDQDNGWLMLRATNVDLAVADDPVAAEGRQLGVIDFTSGWLNAEGRGKPEDRNVELWIPKPAP